MVCVDGVERTLVLPDKDTMKFFIATSGQRYASIVTSKAATVARNQFDCQDLEGAQLENQPTGENSCTGDYWDERMLYPEALSGVNLPTTNVLSPLTLALLEDLGWYRGNHTKANGLCAFFGICRACVCALEGSSLTHPFRMRIHLFVTGHCVGM